MSHSTVSRYASRQTGSAKTLVQALSHPEFMTLAIVCTIGSFITLNVMLRFPDLAAMLVAAA